MAASNLPAYYRDIGDDEIADAFQDFDHLEKFETFDRNVRDPRSRNFVVDFGDEQAWAAFDLSASAINNLLKANRPCELNTRWINIWVPYEQRDVVMALGKHYDFSPRLLGVMCSSPPKPRSKPPSASKSSSSLFHRTSSSEKEHASSKGSSSDAEEHIGMNEKATTPKLDLMRDINHYHIVNEVWHWSSVDWGRRYVCLGYNSLHNIRTDAGRAKEDLPDGMRVWTWLLLCEDKTVFTINEDPYPYKNGNLEPQDRESLITIRRNLVNVFRQCSKAHDSSRENPIMQLPIRKRVGDSEEETAHRSTDTPGLLFYCLFDDWITSYSLVARREHQYAAELNRLREQMLDRAELGHIERLHHIGRQLAVLKRVYESYELVIDRVLEKQEASIASLKNSHVLAREGEESLTASQPQIAESQSLLGVALSSAARVRFERLKYRIRLYALSEIQECLDLKESLVMMNFNLIAIKESYSVERLTRVTLLLAKVTILFMPVSLMTAYYSTQLENVTFTLRSYWICFGVILGVSILALVMFGFISGTMEGKMLYKPLSRTIMDISKSAYRKRKRKGQ